MRFLINLCADLPWWGILVVLGGLIAFVYLAGIWFNWKFNQIVHETILELGSALKGAEAVVHSVTSTPAPGTPSPYDLDEDHEQYSPELDGTPWDAEGVNYYSIDVTITPASPIAQWDPTSLAVVPADFQPDDPTDVCHQLGGMHSAEHWVGQSFVPLREGKVIGPKRVRLLMAVPHGVRAVKFASLVTYFGRVELPTPIGATGPATR